MHLSTLLTLCCLSPELCWGGRTNAQMCPAGSDAVPHAVYDAAWTLGRRAPAAVTAFVDVNVIPMDTKRVLQNQTVLVEGGRITALGPSTKIKVPAGAVRVDGRGRYLIPGLADMHAHITHTEEPTYGETDSAKAVNRLLHLWLANGVTTIRNLSWNGRSAGPLALALRARAAAGELWSPRIYTAGQWFEHTWPSSKWLPAPEQVAPLIAAYKAAGYDFIKVHQEGGQALWDSLIAAARREGLPVVGHAPLADPRTGERRRAWALAAPMKSVEHLYYYPWGDTSSAAIQAVAEEIQRAGVWITPTWMMHQQMGELPPARAAYARRLVQALQAAGAGLLLGTDDVYRKAPVTVHSELQALVEAGLTPYQALLTGTRNVAVYFGTLDETGTVAVGKRADLVLLRGNPLQNIRNTAEPIGTMTGGRWVTRAELAPHWTGLQRRVSYKEYFQNAYGGALSEVAKGISLTKEQRASHRRLDKGHQAHRGALLDSLVSVVDTAAGRERLLRLIARRFGDYRTVLTSEQQAGFDRNARAWVKQFKERGYRLEVPGVEQTVPLACESQGFCAVGDST